MVTKVGGASVEGMIDDTRVLHGSPLRVEDGFYIDGLG